MNAAAPPKKPTAPPKNPAAPPKNPAAPVTLTALGDGALDAAARVRTLNEAEVADLRAAEGERVVERGGRYWIQTFPGFYHPIHHLAEHRAHEKRPALACWGYLAALVPEDRHLANGTYPAHLMEDLSGWAPSRMEESRRRDLRRCLAQVELVVAPDPEPFLSDGWDVYSSARERIRQDAKERDAYLRDIACRVQDPRRVFVAGFIDGRLAGYLESYLVDRIYYGHELMVRTEVTKSGIATGLYSAMLEIARATGRADRVCLGPEITDRPGLAFFKKTLGFPVVRVPTRVVIPGPIRMAVRRLRPATYYRLTGDDSGASHGWTEGEGVSG
jgi:hypothetical protein